MQDAEATGVGDAAPPGISPVILKDRSVLVEKRPTERGARKRQRLLPRSRILTAMDGIVQLEHVTQHDATR